MVAWKTKYSQKKAAAKYVGIYFDLTFEEYFTKAKEAGLINPFQIGKKRDDYQLARYKDSGDYTVNNCRFITQLENTKERCEHDEEANILKSINAKNKIKDGSHHFIGHSTKKVEEGSFFMLGLPPWRNPNMKSISKQTWLLADKIYERKLELLSKNQKAGCIALYNHFKTLSKHSIRTMDRKFKTGWIPTNDPQWIEFKGEKF